MMERLILLLTFISLLCGVCTSYKAAVYEHEVYFPTNRTAISSRTDAVIVMTRNLGIYEQQCQNASKQEAQIIVFPEYGLYGINWTRETIAPYLEYIQDPQEISWNPCDDPYTYIDTEIQRGLSCLAKYNSLYLVANFGSRQPCQRLDPKCPPDGYFQYNTNVVYGPSGKYIARYFKFNLNMEEKKYFDTPEKPDLTTFETPFGKFGTVTSHDILFHDPIVTLIDKMNISNIAFPVAWRDELPLFSAVAFHSSFSEGMQIKLLAANLHLPSAGYHGSGIYWPVGTTNDAVYYYNDTTGSGGQLLVTNFSRRSTHENGLRNKNKLIKNRTISNRAILFNKKNITVTNPKVSRAEINHDLYNIIPLRSTSSGSFKVCHGNLCCNADYEGQFDNTFYVLGAFDGLHTHDGNYYLQVCTLIQCANDSIESCGKPASRSSGYMDKMSFQGNFTVDHVFPEVLTRYDNSYHISTMTWLYQSAMIIDVGVAGSPISLSIIGRNYTRDNI